MPGHDPYDLIGRLRDHLSAHDTPISFLMGAGTSSAVNIAPIPPAGAGPRGYKPLIPAVVGLTAEVRLECIAADPSFETVWESLVSACEERKTDPNIESLLGLLRLTIQAITPSASAFGLDASGLKSLERQIQTAIADVTSPDDSTIPPHTPHDDFAQWVRNARRAQPVEIFTTNYDVLIERSLELAGIPIFDGFVGSYLPFFFPSAVESAEAADWTRVWKIHGSVTWSSVDSVTVRRVGGLNGTMILPSHLKYDESRKMPYLALMDRLSNCASRSNSVIVTAGYSWSDEHINETLLSAMAATPSSAIFALLYDDIQESNPLVQYAKKHQNLTVVGPRSAVVRGQLAPWETATSPSNALVSVLRDYFTPDVAGPGVSPRTGKCTLGDFGTLANFLASMTSHRPGNH